MNLKTFIKVYFNRKYLLVYVLLTQCCDCLSVKDDVIVKCCPEDEGLIRFETSDLSNTYDCISLRDVDQSFDVNILHPLRIGKDSIKFINGFPENCTHTETALSEGIPEKYCIDKLFAINNESQDMISGNGSVIVIKCMNDPPTNVLSLRTVSKCCKKGMIYDVDGHICIRDDGESRNLFEDFIGEESSLLDVKYGILNKCNHPKAVYDYTDKDYTFDLKDDVLMLNDSNKKFILEPGSFCLDDSMDNVLIARGCRDKCDSGSCVNKCCQNGYIRMRKDCNSSSKCVPSDIGFNFSFYDIKREEPVIVEAKGAIGIRYGIVCPNGRYIENKRKTFPDIDSGNLYIVSNKSYEENTYESSYCIDMLHDDCSEKISLISMVCFPDDTETTKENVKYKAYSYGTIISCVFLVATLIVYVALPELRNLHGMTMMCHVTAMLIAYTSLAWVGQSGVLIYCRYFGLLIYFGFLSAFAWLNIMCFDIWWTLGKIRNIQAMKKDKILKRLLMFSLYAWGLPIVLTLATYLFDEYDYPWWLDAEMGRTKCWFSTDLNKMPWIILFVIPIATIIGMNFVLFILTAIHCNKIKADINRMQSRSIRGESTKKRFTSDKAKYSMNIKLFLVMGISWILEILSYIFPNPQELWYATDYMNLLQGVPIFCVLVLKRKVFLLIKKRLGIKLKEPHKTTETVSTPPNSSIQLNSNKTSTASLCSKEIDEKNI